MQNGHSVLVADYEDMEREVVVELLQQGHRDVLDYVLFEVEALQAFRVVLHQHAFPLGLG